MNHKIQMLAGEALSWFEYRNRHDGTVYWAVEDDAPEWVKGLVWAAGHAKGVLLPDDFRYLFIVEALEAIAENPEEPASLLEPDVYTSKLTEWLNAYPSYRMVLVNEAVDQFGWSSLFDALQAGQLLEKKEVLQSVRNFLENTIEEES